jgi:lipoic acid synthetase
MESKTQTKISKPEWLKIKLPSGKTYANVKEIVNSNKLHTICQSGNCPNMGECWGAGTATFMILGDICTRSCKFCNVKTGKPGMVDINEPIKIAQSVALMKLKHCVLTSVDRDDLEDGGSGIWAETINNIRKLCPGTTIESLIPDFQGNKDQINKIIEVAPEVVSHNLETVARLTREVRIQAKYERSLEVLKYLKDKGMRSKSGLMVGLGETKEEIIETLKDLRGVECEILTIGQYLQPSRNHLEVKRFVTPDEFAYYKSKGLELGFKVVESGPLVRSSYHAEKHLY